MRTTLAKPLGFFALCIVACISVPEIEPIVDGEAPMVPIDGDKVLLKQVVLLAHRHELSGASVLENALRGSLLEGKGRQQTLESGPVGRVSLLQEGTDNLLDHSPTFSDGHVGAVIGEALESGAASRSYSSGGYEWNVAKSGNGKSTKQITAALVSLERKINTEEGEETTAAMKASRLCQKTHEALTRVVADGEVSQRDAIEKEFRLRSEKQQAQIDLRASMRVERGLAKAVHEARSSLEEKVKLFYTQNDGRRKDVKTLHASIELICTLPLFAADERCLGHKISHGEIKGLDDQLKKTLSELTAQHDQTIAQQKEEWSIQNKQDLEDIKNGKAPSEWQKSPASYSSGSSVELLQVQSYSTSSKKKLQELILGGVSEAASGPANAVLLSIETGDDEKMKTALSLVFTNIQDLEKRQAQAASEQASRESKSHDMVQNLESSKQAEVSKQFSLSNRITGLDVSAGEARSALTAAIKLREDSERNIALNDATCEEGRVAYESRKQVSGQERSNVIRLRSLLEVALGGDAPSCIKMNSCTKAKQGMCVHTRDVDGNKVSSCSCEKGFAGQSCQKAMCPGKGSRLYTAREQGACNDHGTCNERKGTCTCGANFSHGEKKACEIFKFCPADQKGGHCSGHGRCSPSTGKCACDVDYFGDDCGQKKCPGGASSLRYTSNEVEVCSGHGVCDSSRGGRCACHEGFAGTKCEEKQCPDNCSGHGTCNKHTGVCVCESGFNGNFCQDRACPGGCGGTAGVCDTTSGRCLCNHGFSGPQCKSTHACDVKETDYRSWAMFAEGWSRCKKGSLMTGIKKGTCNGLQCLDQAKCAQPCWGEDKLKVNRCYQANWWDALNGPGSAKCADGFYMAGVYRSKCLSLYCIQMGLCCSIESSRWDKCGKKNWSGELERDNSWASVPSTGGGASTPVGFMTGIERAGLSGGVEDLNFVNYCGFKRTD